MISNTSSNLDSSINTSSVPIYKHQSNDIEISKSLSTSSNNNYQQNINSAPINKSNSSTLPSVNQGNKDSALPKEEGIFSRMFSYIKNNWNPWKIEEEEFIDAHGFKCKRPKNKIPLRNKKEGYENEVQQAGSESVTYATQHSGFGNMFL